MIPYFLKKILQGDINSLNLLVLIAFYFSDLLFPAIGDPIIFGSFTNLCTVAIFILFSVLLLTYVGWPFLFYLFPFLDLQMLYYIYRSHSNDIPKWLLFKV